jgi:hypothetical protein
MEYVLPFAAFLALCYLFWRRAGKPPVQWGWLALIIGLTGAVLLISALTR